MAIKITPIKPSDIASAVDCIQLAFDDDPYNNWAFDRRPEKFNKQRNFYSLKAKVEWGIKNALFYVAKDADSQAPDQVIGVSMWMRPQNVDQPQSWSEWVDEHILWFKQGLNLVWYQGRGGLRTDRYWVWKREQAKTQKAIWTDPNGYYFVNIVTVLPGNQGKGIGRKLFEVVTKVADREGRRCYLESSKSEPNIKIYERMGFHLAQKMACVAEDGTGDQCDLFAMVRNPQAT